MYTAITTLKINDNVYNLQDIDIDIIPVHEDVILFLKQWGNEAPYINVKTSGSTGKPKVLRIEKQKMWYSASMTCNYFNLKANDTALLCMSAQHIGGMMMIVRALYAQLNLISVTPSSNPLNKLNRHIDFAAMVPYQVTVSMKENASKMKAITYLIIGGGTLQYSLEHTLKKENIQAYHTFGMTETISHIALRNIAKDSYFTCLNGITISSNNDNTLCIQAPHLLDNTVLNTNDIVKVIDEKRFIWLGRKDFAIESGGLKMIPERIERKLAPYIHSRFLISSLPDKELNNKIILLIEGNEHILDIDFSVILSKYEKPKAIYFLKNFVETSSGKIDRNNTLNLLIENQL